MPPESHCLPKRDASRSLQRKGLPWFPRRALRHRRACPPNQIAAAPDSPHDGVRSFSRTVIPMAVWQFELDPIPASAALIEGVPAIHLSPEVCDTIVLRLTAGERKELIAAFDALLPPQQAWSPGLMVWGNTRGTDVQLYLDEDGSDALKIRIDAKTFSTELVEALCDIAATFDWVFLTERGAVLHPSPEIVLRALLQSPARAYVENPHEAIAGALDRMREPG